MAGTSAVIPSVGAHEPTPSSSVKTEIDAIGLAPLVPAPMLPPPATSPVSQVQMSTADLFVQYHEYFQKLQLDMQVAQPPAQTPRVDIRAAPPPKPGKAPLISACALVRAAHERGDRSAPDEVRL